MNVHEQELLDAYRSCGDLMPIVLAFAQAAANDYADRLPKNVLQLLTHR